MTATRRATPVTINIGELAGALLHGAYQGGRRHAWHGRCTAHGVSGRRRPPRRARRLAPWVAAASLALLACRSPPAVQVLGGTSRIADGEPSPRHSAVFDGETVSLRAARGETVGVEV